MQENQTATYFLRSRIFTYDIIKNSTAISIKHGILATFNIKQKFGRGPSNEHFWQVWLKSVQRFQRRRFKCEKLTDGRLPMTKAHMAYGQVS